MARTENMKKSKPTAAKPARAQTVFSGPRPAAAQKKVPAGVRKFIRDVPASVVVIHKGEDADRGGLSL